MYLFLSLFFIGFNIAHAADMILTSNVGVNVKTTCSFSGCETIQCYDSTFKNCKSESISARAKCKKKDFKDFTMKVGKVYETVKVCSSFTPDIRPTERGFLRVEKFFEKEFKDQGTFLVFKRIRGSDRPHAFIENEMRYVLYSGWESNEHFGSKHSEELAMVVGCHEVGHFLGGTPQMSSRGQLYSSEGQANHYAYGGCLQRIFSVADDENFVKNNVIDPKIESRCGEAYSSEEELNQCRHLSSLSLEYYKVNPIVDIDTPSKVIVSRTLSQSLEYPDIQCSLDNAIHNILNYPNTDGNELRLPCWFKQ